MLLAIQTTGHLEVITILYSIILISFILLLSNACNIVVKNKRNKRV